MPHRLTITGSSRSLPARPPQPPGRGLEELGVVPETDPSFGHAPADAELPVGGGGHPQASGITLPDCTLKEAEAILVERLGRLLAE